jgi:hypothetical protein
MIIINCFLLLLAALKYASASFNALLITSNDEIPIIIFQIPGNYDIEEVNLILSYFTAIGDFSIDSISHLLHRFMLNYPGSFFHLASRPPNNLTEQELRNFYEDTIRAAYTEFCTRIPRDLDDWKRSINITNEKLPIRIGRSSIISDAVEAYKNIDRIPFIIPRHLFNINIKVTFIGEDGVDYGGPRNEFFSLFFRSIIQNSGLFALNSEGYVTISPDRTSIEDLDTYEAFGFYLAKAFQNNFSIGCHFAQIIVELIKFGKLQFNSLDLLESWDSQLNSILKSMEMLSSDELRNYNFNDINPEHPSLVVTPFNVKNFTIEKFRYEIISNFQIQLLMITLGFVRACPGHVITKSDLNLAEAFGGKNSITADELISAISIQTPVNLSTLGFFAQWLRSLNTDQLMIIFRFVTGMRVIPPGNLVNLNIKIVVSSPGTEHLLVQANTCQRFFILPPYTTEEQAMERFSTLLRQLESGDAFCFGFA